MEVIEQYPNELITALIEQHYGQHIEVVDQQIRAVLMTPESRVRYCEAMLTLDAPPPISPTLLIGIEIWRRR